MTDSPSRIPSYEADYNVRDARPDFAHLMARFESDSRAYRERYGEKHDYCYGTGYREQLDLFRCRDADAPVLVFLHGGYWQRGDRSLYSFIAEPFVRNGVNVVMVGYPLCPEHSLFDIFQSIRRALIWLRNHGHDHGVNPDRINLCGHSASGHLATLCMTTKPDDQQNRVPQDIVRAGISISGIYQLSPLRHTSIGDALDLDDRVIRLLSPQARVPAPGTPLLVAVGERETRGFHEQAEQLLSDWHDSGLDMDRHIEPEADHFDIMVRLGMEGSGIFEKVLKWLR